MAGQGRERLTNGRPRARGRPSGPGGGREGRAGAVRRRRGHTPLSPRGAPAPAAPRRVRWARRGAGDRSGAARHATAGRRARGWPRAPCAPAATVPPSPNRAGTLQTLRNSPIDRTPPLMATRNSLRARGAHADADAAPTPAADRGKAPADKAAPVPRAAPGWRRARTAILGLYLIAWAHYAFVRATTSLDLGQYTWWVGEEGCRDKNETVAAVGARAGARARPRWPRPDPHTPPPLGTPSSCLPWRCWAPPRSPSSASAPAAAPRRPRAPRPARACPTPSTPSSPATRNPSTSWPTRCGRWPRRSCRRGRREPCGSWTTATTRPRRRGSRR